MNSREISKERDGRDRDFDREFNWFKIEQEF